MAPEIETREGHIFHADVEVEPMEPEPEATHANHPELVDKLDRRDLIHLTAAEGWILSRSGSTLLRFNGKTIPNDLRRDVSSGPRRGRNLRQP